MVDKEPNDEGQLNESFNEDFDFGESGVEAHETMQTISRSTGFQKKQLVGFAFLLVILGISWASYKYLFHKGSKPTETKISTTKPTVTATPAPNVMHPPAVITPSSPAATPTPPPPAGESFGEIAQAFSSADQGLQTPRAPGAAPGGAPGTPPQGIPPKAFQPGQQGQPGQPAHQGQGTGNIQELQKELFSPEKGAASGTNAPTPTEIAQLTQNLNKLNQQIDFILNKIKYLDGYTQEVSENLTKFNESLTAMDRRLSSLTNTTTSLSKDVGNVRNEVGQVRKVLREDGLDINLGSVTGRKQRIESEGSVSIEEPEYMVHAVIPGRAWLKSRRGHIITITEGDTIGNYGKILVIDAANGVVLTSSGVTFH